MNGRPIIPFRIAAAVVRIMRLNLGQSQDRQTVIRSTVRRRCRAATMHIYQSKYSSVPVCRSSGISCFWFEPSVSMRISLWFPPITWPPLLVIQSILP